MRLLKRARERLVPVDPHGVDIGCHPPGGASVQRRRATGVSERSGKLPRYRRVDFIGRYGGGGSENLTSAHEVVGRQITRYVQSWGEGTTASRTNTVRGPCIQPSSRRDRSRGRRARRRCKPHLCMRLPVAER